MFGYSEGNTYTPIQKWTIFVSETTDEPWSTLLVTEDKDEVNRYVVDLNSNFDYQRYAMAQHTV